MALNRNSKYILTSDNHIYKWVENKEYYLKMTPWEDGEDRRVSPNDIGEYTRISFSSAMTKLNLIWNSGVFTWRFNGDNYMVYPNIKPSLDGESFNPLHKAPTHDFPNEWTDRDGERRISHDYYRICFYQGKIYWAKNSHYYPQIMLLKFEGMDVPPDWRKHVKWANFKHCRPIFKEVYNIEKRKHEWERI